MKKMLATALALSALSAAVPVSAAVVNLNLTTAIAGTFAGVQTFNGNGILTGTFEFNDIGTGAAVSNFSALYTDGNGGGVQNFALGTGATALYNGTNLTFTQGGTTVFSFAISDLVTNNGNPPASANTTSNATSFIYGGNLPVTINAGSTGTVFADVVGGVGGVPEPTTWALMLGGFGVVGFASRRRRNVKNTFA